ncbi:MAG: hypothetical protein ABJR05_06165 [Balneola sp.]
MKWNIVVDRSKKKALLAIGATLIAFLLSLPLYSADVTQVSDFFLVG